MPIYYMNRTLRNALLDGPKQTGNYNPKDVMVYIEEHLTNAEWLTAKRFLQWVHQNDKHYGHGTIDEVFAQWAEEVKG